MLNSRTDRDAVAKKIWASMSAEKEALALSCKHCSRGTTWKKNGLKPFACSFLQVYDICFVEMLFKSEFHPMGLENTAQ